MVLNRALSFNGAGATLRPLGNFTHAQIETLYHELFHAYIDHLVTAAEASPEVAPDPLLAFAKVQQGCHYGAVLITPVVQRKSETEERFLTERESWEALNETWAVFVGWVVWNQLELTSRSRIDSEIREESGCMGESSLGVPIEKEFSVGITNRKIRGTGRRSKAVPGTCIAFVGTRSSGAYEACY